MHRLVLISKNKTLLRAITLSDLEWMKSRITTAIREGRDFEQSDHEGEKNATVEDEPKEPMEILFEATDPQEFTQAILNSARLFV
ncbi:hypothetical protein K439DRAFT_770611 [Ramaria rubella]|nr:hypothetical protein K439DRAFT_770611 [Ramaria rubella]